jgi:hypothetical protein
MGGYHLFSLVGRTGTRVPNPFFRERVGDSSLGADAGLKSGAYISRARITRSYRPKFPIYCVLRRGQAGAEAARSGEKKKEKLEYMHANPVKRKLVGHPKDWPWSSFSFYASGEAGLIPMEVVD